ncbi:MAG: phosphatase 2C-like domain-containing protein [Monoraphidium minutum]|nr:MAG: phosphatase 2C-like domain-containing protein [Monoraphidium minutum]
MQAGRGRARDEEAPLMDARPAAAWSFLSNERGSAVEDCFVLMDDLLLELAPHAHDEPAAAAARGARDAAAPAWSPQLPVVPTIRMFGVYDGHGGGAAAKHCARRLHHFVAARLHAALRAGGEGGGGGACGCALLDSPAVATALREAFVATDTELKATGLLDSNSGSTAVVALLTPNTVWLAWAGDSRAILVRGGQAVAATSDHKPAREDEKERIEQAGGLLLNNGGLRLMGMLATTRAIGDHDLQPYGLTPVPEVMAIPRSGDDEFLVLASDGLWDKVAPDEAASFAHSAWARVARANGGDGGNIGGSGGGSGDCSPTPSPPAAPQLLLLGEGAARSAAAAAAAAPAATAGAPAPRRRTCAACKAARVAAAAMTKCARSRRSRDDTTVVVVNLRRACGCASSWATIGDHCPAPPLALAGSSCDHAGALLAAARRGAAAGPGSGAAAPARAEAAPQPQPQQQQQQQPLPLALSKRRSSFELHHCEEAAKRHHGPFGAAGAGAGGPPASPQPLDPSPFAMQPRGSALAAAASAERGGAPLFLHGSVCAGPAPAEAAAAPPPAEVSVFATAAAAAATTTGEAPSSDSCGALQALARQLSLSLAAAAAGAARQGSIGGGGGGSGASSGRCSPGQEPGSRLGSRQRSLSLMRSGSVERVCVAATRSSAW